MPKILITGGAGFIGSNIATKLLEYNNQVVVFDNFSTGKEENLSYIIDKIKIIEGDIRNYLCLLNAMQDIDYVLHQAALPSVPRSLADPKSSHEVNVDGTFNVLLAARNASVKRVVYASSSSVYGDTLELPKKEDFMPNPKSPYAVSKLAGEYYCKIFYKCFGLETMILRYFNVFGPHQDPESQYSAAIPRFIKSIYLNESPTIFGDGLQTRDFTFVGNVVEANINAMSAKIGIGEVYNVGCGKTHEINKLIKLLNKIMKKNIEPRYVDKRSGDIRDSLADISKAKRYLGYIPMFGFEEGLVKTVEWFTKICPKTS